MRTLKVWVEINGSYTEVGDISGDSASDAVFTYSSKYIADGGSAISVSLPVSTESFSPQQTRCFFEGLLPEGFTRRSVAGYLRVDEGDYLSILAGLGRECIGAIRITDGEEPAEQAAYHLLNVEQVRALAREGASKSAEIVTRSHLSLTGASGKVGLMYFNGNWYQPIYDAPSSHIVKQSHIRLDSIVLNEHLALTAAGILGLDAAESFVVNIGDGADDEVLLASRRFDRLESEAAEIVDGIRRPYRLHQEDFAQAMGISSANKYEQPGEHYLADMFDIIRRYSVDPLEDSLKLWRLTVFDFLVGNTDNHIKNNSLLYLPSLRAMRLAPAYDIVSTCIYPESTRDMAYNIGGKYSLDDIRRSDFAAAAEECGLGVRIAMREFDSLADRFEKSLAEAADELAAQGLNSAYGLRERVLSACGYKGL